MTIGGLSTSNSTSGSDWPQHEPDRGVLVRDEEVLVRDEEGVVHRGRPQHEPVNAHLSRPKHELYEDSPRLALARACEVS